MKNILITAIFIVGLIAVLFVVFSSVRLLNLDSELDCTYKAGYAAGHIQGYNYIKSIRELQEQAMME